MATLKDNVLPMSKGKIAIVEFTGLTGTGKTTLLAAVKDQLSAQGLKAVDAYDVILSRYRLNITRNPKLRSLLIDAVSFLPFLRYILTPTGLALLRLAFRVTKRLDQGVLVTLNLWRNFAKRLGVHMLLTRLRNQIDNCNFVVCDEGTLHIAHNLFVHVGSPPDPCEVAYFGSIVPQPDIIIWVRAAQEQSVESVLRRGHPRVGKSVNAAQRFVENGYLAFDALCSQEIFQDKLFVIDNGIDSAANNTMSKQWSAQVIAASLMQNEMVGVVDS